MQLTYILEALKPLQKFIEYKAELYFNT